jgi:predicted hotdog family 3-hydroxylacyl-ACP dehydratase
MTFGNNKLIILQTNILSIIPQRPPFVMVDELVACDGISSRTTLRVDEENILVFKGELSAAGLIENIAQTAAAGVGYMALSNGQPVLTGYIGAIKNLEIFALPKVGEMVETEVVIERQVFDVTMIAGSVSCRGVLLAKCEMKIFIKQ